MQQSFFDISVKKKHVALEKIWVTASKYYLPLTLLFYIGCRWLIPFSTSITISSSSSLLGDEVAVVIAHFSYFISIPGLVTFFSFFLFPKYAIGCVEVELDWYLIDLESASIVYNCS